ncbi:hypothetical protein GCM10023340_16970 [Nocardioides marinquilinus]|uniref:Histidine kinase/HSP90-like ATPase domain-containing protein n=1 Tax=Nocardioides marinquilinus TaxID=1210400 RepID=A0ABP9PMX8_9ACTN
MAGEAGRGAGRRAPTVDAVVAGALRQVSDEPEVARAGLALVEGGGRRLRFTASDRTSIDPADPAGPDDPIDWCHIDAYDDVPLTLVARTGENVAGMLPDLHPLFPGYVEKQMQTETRALVAVPLALHGQVLGGLLAFAEDPPGAAGPVDPADLQRRISRHAVALADALRVAQLRAPRDDGGLAATVAPDGALVADAVVDGHPRAVGEARRFVRRHLGEWEVDDDVVDTVVLCLSEIVTNAVVHTGAASELRMALDEGVLTVAVRDQGSHHGERPDPVREGHGSADDPLRVHGRGLQLVEALAARWGSEPDAVGTTVWFVFDLA